MISVEPRQLVVEGTADAVGPLARRALWWRWRHRYALEWPASVDDRFARFWLRAMADGRRRIIGERSRAFLGWRWSHPDEPSSLAALADAHSREVAGYAALRRRGDRAHIGDLFAVDDGAYAPLLDGLLARLAAEGVECVDICFLGRAAVVASLRWRGFRPREESRAVVVDTGRLDAPWLLDAERWHLASADGDL